MSNLIIIKGFDTGSSSREWRIFYTNRELSDVDLLGMKTPCSLETNLDKMGFNTQ